MNCQEALELVTPAVDGKLSIGVEAQLQEHFEKCHACRSEFELERITKRVLKQHLHLVPVPRALSARITAGLAAETSARPAPEFQIFKFLLQPTWRTLATVATAAVAILLFVLVPLKPQHSHARPLDGDVINQTYNNFSEVLKGGMVPAISSEDPSAVEKYIDSRVGFHAHVPKFKHCRLVGGVFSHYNDENVANVIYRQKDNLVYLYQARLGSVMAGRTLHIPDCAKKELLGGGYYFENQCPGCTLVLWVMDSTVCCAVADMDKPELLTVIKDTE